MRNSVNQTPLKDLIAEDDLKTAINTLWEAYAIAEIIGSIDTEEAGVHITTLQTALNGVNRLNYTALELLGGI